MVTGLFLFAFNLYKTATAPGRDATDGDDGAARLDDPSRTPKTLTAPLVRR